MFRNPGSPTVSFFFFKLKFYFMRRGILPECMSLDCVHAIPAEARRGCHSSGTGVTAGCEPPGGFWWVLLIRAVSALILWATSPVPLLSFPSFHLGTSALVSQLYCVVLPSLSFASLAGMYRCYCIRRARSRPQSLNWIPKSSHVRRRELNPPSYPLTATHKPWNVHMCTRTYTLW